jgi:16S rRNA (guanine527-N7)-methyltransferase
MPEIIFKYFPSLQPFQKEKFEGMKAVYELWNSRINVISRKDMVHFYTHHVLHSLAIARIISFQPGTTVLDVGTGGGFPGIPLALLFPDTEFTLLDSIEKKIKVVAAAAEELNLKNVRPLRKRVEQEEEKYDFVISRAVTDFKTFARLTGKNISETCHNTLHNGIIYLKGGELGEELGELRSKVILWEVKDFFSEPFFETKKIVYLPVPE